MTLADLHNEQIGIITKVKGRGAFRKRITEMGFVKGQTVKVIKNAPLKDPVEYSIMSYEISLRRSEAALIEVITPDEAGVKVKDKFKGMISEEWLRKKAEKKGRLINVAMVGNPNAGKTTIFNFATKSRERVGNYGGVTIDAKHGQFSLKGYKFNIVDLPGTYSLTAYSPEELFVREHITDQVPDVVINVVDASNLERNLFLTTQLIDMDIKVVMALNMYDEMLEAGDNLDYESLGKMTGIPVVPTIGSKNIGINDLFTKVIDVYEDEDRDLRHVHINYGGEIERSIGLIQEKIKHKDNLNLTDKVSSRFLSIKMLEKDNNAEIRISGLKNFNEIRTSAQNEINRLEGSLSEDSETLVTDAKYGFISGALRETMSRGQDTRQKKSEVIDNILTHQVFGFPFFLLFIFIMFQATFSLGEYPMQWIENLITFTGGFLDSAMNEGSLKDLLINGILGGVGGVIVFLPNILILFFFISLMEDTGYMARAAFIMDKLMHKIGLHGKSFIPLIMGFGCNVPAIMATRTIENRNNRLLTMLINPFMSCSARLPVYVLIIGAFFPDHPGIVLFSMYGLGILMAVIVAIIFKKTLFRSSDVPFVMELPPYRIPTIRTTIRHMWHKGSQYLRKMGGIILVASIIIWALGYFPVNNQLSGDTADMTTVSGQTANEVSESGTVEGSGITEVSGQTGSEDGESGTGERSRITKDSWHTDPEYAVTIPASQRISYIERIGMFIEPVIKPLGFDWKMGVALLSGIAAKEIVVSTMGVLYHASSEASLPTESLGEKLQQQTYPDGSKVFTTASALSFLVFILLYFPCVAVIAAIKNESGHWKWAAFTVLYTTGLAYLMSFLVYQTISVIF
jgi:ferrous iron transport protein B